jgi:hypothetical protein
VTDSDLRIVIAPTRDHFHFRDDRNQADTIKHHVQERLGAAVNAPVRVEIERNIPRPSRYSATPAEIDAFLCEHFAEDVLLRYQWAVGSAVLDEACNDLRTAAEREGIADDVQDWATAADYIDPKKDGFRLPSNLVSFNRPTTTEETR